MLTCRAPDNLAELFLSLPPLQIKSPPPSTSSASISNGTSSVETPRRILRPAQAQANGPDRKSTMSAGRPQVRQVKNQTTTTAQSRSSSTAVKRQAPTSTPHKSHAAEKECRPLSLGETNPEDLKKLLRYVYLAETMASAQTNGPDNATSSDDGTDSQMRKDLTQLWSTHKDSDIVLRVDPSPPSRDASLRGSPAAALGPVDGSSSSSCLLPWEDAGEEETIGRFSVHRFILVSRSPYFASQLLSSFSDAASREINLPSPPFTPTAVFFTLGFLYTGTLNFSSRTFDLTTAFQIWRAAAYLQVSSLVLLTSSIIYNDFCHRFLCPGPCSTCLRRVPRTLAFAVAPDVADATLRRRALEAVAGPHFASYWGREVGSMAPTAQDKIVAIVLGRIDREAGAVVPVIEQILRLRRRLDAERSIKWTDALRAMATSIEEHVQRKWLQNYLKIVATEECQNALDGIGLLTDVIERSLQLLVDGMSESQAPSIYAVLSRQMLQRGEEGLPAGPIRDLVEKAKASVVQYMSRRLLNLQTSGAFSDLDKGTLKDVAADLETSPDELVASETAPATPKTKTGLKMTTAKSNVPSRLTGVSPGLARTPPSNNSTTPTASRSLQSSRARGTTLNSQRSQGQVSSAASRYTASPSTRSIGDRTTDLAASRRRATAGGSVVRSARPESSSPSGVASPATRPAPTVDRARDQRPGAARIKEVAASQRDTPSPSTRRLRGAEQEQQQQQQHPVTGAETGENHRAETGTTSAPAASEEAIAPEREASSQPVVQSKPPITAKRQPTGSRVASLAARFSSAPASSSKAPESSARLSPTTVAKPLAPSDTHNEDAGAKLPPARLSPSPQGSESNNRGTSLATRKTSPSPSENNEEANGTLVAPSGKALDFPRLLTPSTNATTSLISSSPRLRGASDAIDSKQKQAEAPSASSLSPPPRIRAASVANMMSLKQAARKRVRSTQRVNAGDGGNENSEGLTGSSADESASPVTQEAATASASKSKEVPSARVAEEVEQPYDSAVQPFESDMAPAVAAKPDGNQDKTEAIVTVSELPPHTNNTDSHSEMTPPEGNHAAPSEPSASMPAERVDDATIEALDQASSRTLDSKTHKSIVQAQDHPKNAPLADNSPREEMIPIQDSNATSSSTPEADTTALFDGAGASQHDIDTSSRSRPQTPDSTAQPSAWNPTASSSDIRSEDDPPQTPKALRKLELCAQSLMSDTTPRPSRPAPVSAQPCTNDFGQQALSHRLSSMPATTLSVGIPCIIWPALPGLPPRSRLRALIKYIGPVEGFGQNMVGVQALRPLPDGLRDWLTSTFDDDEEGIHFNDGSYRGKRYFVLSPEASGTPRGSSRSTSGASSRRPSSSNPRGSGIGISHLSEHLDLFAKAEREARRRRIARLQASASAVSGASAPLPAPRSRTVSVVSVSAPTSPELERPAGPSMPFRPRLPTRVSSAPRTGSSSSGTGESSSSEDDDGGSASALSYSSDYEATVNAQPPAESSRPRLQSTVAASTPYLTGTATSAPRGHSGDRHRQHGSRGQGRMPSAFTPGLNLAANMERSSSERESSTYRPFSTSRPPSPLMAFSSRASTPASRDIDHERRSSWSPALTAKLSAHNIATSASQGATAAGIDFLGGSRMAFPRGSADRTHLGGISGVYAHSTSRARSQRRSPVSMSRQTSHSALTTREEQTGTDGLPSLGLFVTPDEVMWVFDGSERYDND